jgi:hypothetical protein
MALPEGTYTVHIESTTNANAKATVSNVVVTRQQVTNIGTITLTTQ